MRFVAICIETTSDNIVVCSLPRAKPGMGKRSHGNNYPNSRPRARPIALSPQSPHPPPPCPTPMATSPTNFSSSPAPVMLQRRNAKSVKVPRVNRRKEESQSEYVLCRDAWNGNRIQLSISTHLQPLFAPVLHLASFVGRMPGRTWAGKDPKARMVRIRTRTHWKANTSTKLIDTSAYSILHICATTVDD